MNHDDALEALRVSGETAGRPALPARVSERDLAYSLAAWFAGGDFDRAGQVWVPYPGTSTMLDPDGDALYEAKAYRANTEPKRGRVLLATRGPAVVHEGPKGADFANARALCRLVIRGEHRALYSSASIGR